MRVPVAPLFFVAIALAVAAPTAFADTATSTLPAGFAPGSIWASKMAPTAGDKITLYTVVYDSSSAGIEGAVSFSVDGTIVGTTPFTLSAGDTSVKSVSWVATGGTHRINAAVESAIETDSKLPAHLATTTTSTVSLTVSAASSTAAGGTASSTNNTTVSNLIAKVASTSPIVGTIANTVYNTTESIRHAGQNLLESQAGTPVGTTTATSTSGTAKNGEVLGTTTYKAAPVVLGTPIQKTGLLASVSRALLPLFKYPALFYPIFFFVLALVFFLVAKNLRNPKRR